MGGVEPSATSGTVKDNGAIKRGRKQRSNMRQTKRTRSTKRLRRRRNAREPQVDTEILKELKEYVQKTQKRTPEHEERIRPKQKLRKE